MIGSSSTLTIAPTASYAETGAVWFRGASDGFIIGAGGGEGTLRYRGRLYPLSGGDIGIAVFGAAASDLAGRVYNLRRPSDIVGAYTVEQSEAERVLHDFRIRTAWFWTWRECRLVVLASSWACLVARSLGHRRGVTRPVLLAVDHTMFQDWNLPEGEVRESAPAWIEKTQCWTRLAWYVLCWRLSGWH